jgi:demethylmenaquinone methyltransferase/2-methoxy-6-polyprenyl-1,4-benzoquinol methylase
MNCAGTDLPEDEYARFARIYDILVEPLLHGIRRDVASMVERSGAASVLDVACGTGRQLSMLGGAARRACVDASRSMLEQAGSKTGPSIEYHVGDAASLPFEDGRFDLAMISFALHEMEAGKRPEVLAEMLRVLAPGGSLLAVDYLEPRSPGQGIGHAVARLAERAAGRRHYRNYRDFLKLGGLEGLFASSGLEAETSGSYFLGAVGIMIARK